MLPAPIPGDELERLKALEGLHILDTPPEERFDIITSAATKVFRVPISTLTLVDSDREWFKSCQGVSEKERPRQISFCGHALLTEKDAFVVVDTKLDSRFADNPMVIGEPFIRFYAGIPLFSLGEKSVGVFCIKDTKPRTISEGELYLLQTFASWAELELDAIGLGKILKNFQAGQMQSSDTEKVGHLLRRILNRDVFRNLKSIRFALSFASGDGSGKENEKTEKALDRIETLVLKLKQLEI